MSAYVDQSDLELQFTAQRVAQVFSVQASDGSTVGTVDADSLAYAIRMGSTIADRILIGAYAASMPFPEPYLDALKQCVGPLVMHEGMIRRPEYFGTDVKTLPYHAAACQAREDLKEMRNAIQRLDLTIKPANVGGQLTTSQPSNQQPWTFIADSVSGRGGFNSSGY